MTVRLRAATRDDVPVIAELIRGLARYEKLEDHVEMTEELLAAGLVDNKIASFSETQGAMRFVYRLRDRPT